jgi:two-component system, NarL family, response regulator NreC
MKAPVRILLVEDHDIVREGLRSLITDRDGCQVVAEARTGYEALELARAAQPEVAIVDINMPEMNGIETTRRLLECQASLRVIGLSVHAGGRFMNEMLAAGAVGYLPKKCAARELFDAIRTVLKGRMYISPEVAHAGAPEGGGRSLLAVLSPREREVLQLLAEGRSTKEAASVLKLAVATVHTHRQNIMRKLHCASVADLTRLAIREGIVSLDCT